MGKKLYWKLMVIDFALMLMEGMWATKAVRRTIASLSMGMSLGDFTAQEEAALAENIYKKDFFVAANGLFHRVLGQRSMNGVVLLDNGHGTEPMTDCSDLILKGNAGSVKAFSDWCSARKITFTYVQVPYKNEAGNSLLPAGIVDYSNDIADRFGEYVIEHNVDYLDLRETVKKTDRDFYEMFYRTEHHWNAYAGFEAFDTLVGHMEALYGDKVDHDVLNLDNYKIDIYEKRHFGYYGSTRTGRYFIRPEDFYVISPQFETRQTCFIPHLELIREGTFYDTILDQEVLDDTSVHGMYHAYIGGDYPLVVHESETAGTDKSILLFIDSFGTLPESFLTTVYKKVVAVDLRWVLRNGWNTTAAEYVDEYNPDHVVVMFNPNQLSYENSEQSTYGTAQ